MDNQLVLRDRPIALWIVAVVFFFGSAVGVLSGLWFALIPMGLSVIGGLFLSTLTITADRNTRLLTLDYRSVLRPKTIDIPLTQIESITVQRSRSSEGSDTYRVAVVQTDGEVIPLRSYYSSGRKSKERVAEQLRQFIGVGGSSPTAFGIGELLGGRAKVTFADSDVEEQETDGVRWTIQQQSQGVGMLLRWFSPTFQTTDSFLLLTQKAEGQDAWGKGILGNISEMIYKQVLGLYGFSAADTPNLQKAELVTDLDKRLTPHFFALTPDEANARRLLNVWASLPIARWADRYPLKKVTGAGVGQLAVLFSPQGVYLVLLDEDAEARRDELIALGVEVVGALG